MAATVARVIAAQDEMAISVELRFSCEGLRNRDALSLSDPMIVVFLKSPSSDTWTEIGRTEIVKNDLTPVFATAVTVEYQFESVQKLSFRVYDQDASTHRLDAHDQLGTAECLLANLVNAPGSTLTLPIIGGAGRMKIVAEEKSKENADVTLSFRAFNLDKMDFFSKSDPFLLIYRSREDGGWSLVKRTETIKNNLNPVWAPFTLTSQTLCNGDWDRTIKIECYDYDEGDNDDSDLIGATTTSLRELASLSRKDMELINDAKRAKNKKYRNSGVLNITACDVVRNYGLLEFLAGGLEVGVMCAIDYTASNGAPSTTASLHYRNPYAPNEYQKALAAVVDVLEPYDADAMLPCVGFGANIGGTVEHCFPVAGPNNWFVHGREGVMAAYEASFSRPGLKLHGPTNFSPIINYAMQMAGQKNTQEDQKYFVLLILTDGEISDMSSTIRNIVDSADLPLSIIIVGVGQADFDNMNVLDADINPLSYDNKVCSRDLVQFVPFRDFASQHPSELAKAVLKEIPDQLLKYMRKKKIVPNPPRPAVPPPPFEDVVAPPPPFGAGAAGGPPAGPPPPFGGPPAGPPPPAY